MFIVSFHVLLLFISAFFFFSRICSHQQRKNTLICNHITQAFIKLNRYGFFLYYFLLLLLVRPFWFGHRAQPLPVLSLTFCAVATNDVVILNTVPFGKPHCETISIQNTKNRYYSLFFEHWQQKTQTIGN